MVSESQSFGIAAQQSLRSNLSLQQCSVLEHFGRRHTKCMFDQQTYRGNDQIGVSIADSIVEWWNNYYFTATLQWKFAKFETTGAIWFPSTVCWCWWWIRRVENCVQKYREALSITTNLLGWLPNRVPFEFPRLTDLELGADSLETAWINFVIVHQNLVKLQLDVYNIEVNEDQLTIIASGLTNLIELNVSANVSPESNFI